MSHKTNISFNGTLHEGFVPNFVFYSHDFSSLVSHFGKKKMTQCKCKCSIALALYELLVSHNILRMPCPKISDYVCNAASRHSLQRSVNRSILKMPKLEMIMRFG